MLSRWLVTLLFSVVFLQAPQIQAAVDLQANGAIYDDYFGTAAPTDFRFGDIRYALGFNQTLSSLVQTQTSLGNQTIVTVSKSGDFRLWFYANSYLGYIDPIHSNLLLCQRFNPLGKNTSLVDCKVKAATYDIPTGATYPNGQPIQSAGGVLYYSNGSILKENSGAWRYANGIQLNYRAQFYDEVEDSFYWPTGVRVNHSVTRDRYYPDGGALYDWTSQSLRHKSGGFFSSNAGVAKYLDQSDIIAHNAAGSLLLKFPDASIAKNLSELTDEPRIKINYPSNVPSNSWFKRDLSPFRGHIQDENGVFYISGTERIFSFPSALTEIPVVAAEFGDLIAVLIDQPSAVSAVLQIRELPPSSLHAWYTHLTDHSVRIHWTNSSGTGVFKVNARAGILGYEDSICYLPGVERDGDEDSALVDSLAPDTNYSFQVCERQGSEGDYWYTPRATLVGIRTYPQVNLTKTSTQAKLSVVAGVKGYRYQLEDSPNFSTWNLFGGSAEAAGRNSTSATQVLSWTDTQAGPSQKFYRVRRMDDPSTGF